MSNNLVATYDDLIDQITMAELTGSPCVLIRCDLSGDDFYTEVFRAGARTHEVAGMIAIAHSIVHRTVVTDG